MSSYPPPTNRGSPVYNPVNYNVPNFGAGTAGADVATQGGNNNFTGTNTFLGITSSGINSISGYASLNGSNEYSNASINTFKTSATTGNLPVYFQQDTSLSTTQLGQDMTSNNLDILNSVAGSGIYFSDSSNNFTLTANSSGQAVFSGGVAGAVSLAGTNNFTGTCSFTQNTLNVGGITIPTTGLLSTFTELYSQATSGSAGGTAIFTQGIVNVNNAITLDPSGSVVTATSFVGALTGNATTATSATSATTATNIAGGTANQVPYQTGVGTTSFTSGGSQGQVLTYNSASAPTWTTISSGGGGNVSTNTSNSYVAGTIQEYQTTSTGTNAQLQFKNNTNNNTAQLAIDPNTGSLGLILNTNSSGFEVFNSNGAYSFNLYPTTTNQIGSTNPLYIPTTGSYIAGYAPLASPALTGTPTAPTPVNTDNSTTIATTAFCNSLITSQNNKYTFVSDASGTSKWDWTNPFIPATAYSFYWTITDKNPVNALTYSNSQAVLYVNSNASQGFCASGYAYRVNYASISPVATGSALVPTTAISYQGLPTAPTFVSKEGTLSGINYLPQYTCVLPNGTAVSTPIYLYLTLTAIV